MAETQKMSLEMTESCAKRISALREAEGNENLMLRVTVSGGGCSGFQYGLDFDDTVKDDDHVFERDGAKIITDEMSLAFLNGATIDFVQNLMGSFFKVENPNAASSCGCGTSFSV